MRMRALLALLVLLGMLPVQGGTGASAGRADAGPTVLFMHSDGNGTFGLSPDLPAGNSSVILENNGSVVFTLSDISALRMARGLDELLFRLELGLVSLNMSGIRISCVLELDYLGNGSAVDQLVFNDHTTTVALEPELAIIEKATLGQYFQDFRQGSLRLNITRTDRSFGLLELLCGNDQNQSSLSVPYGAPLRADAGAERSVKVNATVGFNGSLSGSVDPAATEYLWNFGNGMTGAGQEVATSYNRPGTYNVTLTLRWNGLEANDTAHVVVAPNLAPIAVAGQNVTRRIGENYTFRGGGFDPDGTVVSYDWTFGDGTGASGQNVTHSYGSPGNYTAVLTVRDDGGAEGQDELTVHINHPPRITNITVARSGGSWIFTAAADDQDTVLTPTNYVWLFGDGANGTGAQATHRYGATGTYVARCTVTDGYGDNDTASVNVTVTNAPPRITSLGLTGTSFPVNSAVRFRPAASDPDGDELTYYWTFGDGTTSTDTNPNHYYTGAGAYKVTLRISDGVATETMTDTLTIEESTDGLSSTLLGLLPCIVTFVLLIILMIARAVRRGPSQGGQYGQYQTGTGLPSPTQPYGARYTQYGGQYQPYGAPPQPLGGQYQAAPAPPRAPRPPKGPPGVCPRCGSADQQRFPDGHAKCNSCKKVFFTG